MLLGGATRSQLGCELGVDRDRALVGDGEDLEHVVGVAVIDKERGLPVVGPLLGQARDADVLVGNMGSHTSRLFYHRMIAAAATSVLPPFVSVDGYGLCCDFTEKCSVGAIRERGRAVRECIYSYGLATGGDQFFFHTG